MHKVYYTLEEARKVLPEVRNKLKRIIKLKRAVEIIDSISIESDDYNMQYDLLSLGLYKKYHRLMYKMFDTIQFLTSRGVIVKDIDEGLVDFYSTFDNREILLCWKFGESTIKYWHYADDGFESRQSVSLLERSKV
jgi:hypothetical protein